MESPKPTPLKKITAIIITTSLSALIMGLFYYFSEPLESQSSAGGFLIGGGSFTYEARRNFAFIFGIIRGGYYGLILSILLVLIKERRFILLTLYGFLFGLVYFLIYYLYRLHYINQTWNDAYTISLMSNQAFEYTIHIVGICTITGFLTYFIKRISLK